MNERKGPNGFLIGLIVGGAIGALISTKKGRKIVKDVVDYGIDYVGNTINIDDLENILDEEEMMAGEMEVEKKTIKTEETKTEAKSTTASEEPSRRKRIFRGIKK